MNGLVSGARGVGKLFGGLAASLVLIAAHPAHAGTRSQGVLFDPIPDQTYGVGIVPLHAIADSGLPITFSSQSPGICHISGPDSNGVMYAAVDASGTCNLLAEQLGDSNWDYAVGGKNFFISKADQRVDATINGALAYGQSAQLAYGSSVVGYAVTVSVQTPAFCSVSGNNVTGLAGGTCTLTFTQPGDNRYNPASKTISATVFPNLQANLMFNFNSQTMKYGDSQAVTITGGSGTGAVSLSSNNANCTPNGLSFTATGVGTCTITATKASDGNYQAATISQGFTIGQADQPPASITFTGANEYGAVLTINYTGGAGTGAVSFSSDNAACVINGNQVTLTALGGCSITGIKQADANYKLGGAVNSFSVQKATQVLTVTPPGAKNVGDPPFTLQAQSNAGFTVRVSLNTTTGVCSNGGASGMTVTILAAGTCTLYMVTDGDSNHNSGGPLIYSFTIGAGTQSITFSTPATLGYGGTVTLNAAASSGLAVTFTSNTPGVCAVSGNVVSAVSQGTCSIAADQAGNANYSAAPQQVRTFTVGKGTQVIHFGAVPSLHMGDTGTISVTGGASGQPVILTSATPTVCTLSGNTVSVLRAGTCSITADQAGDSNYNAATQATLAFNVIAGDWHDAGAPPDYTYAAGVALLPDGRVFAGSGDYNSSSLDHAMLYDPTSGVWTTTPSLPNGDYVYYATATTLGNGKVLLAGGSGGGNYNAYLYDPTSNSWTATGNTAYLRYGHTATKLADGKVLVVGGVDGNGSNILVAELYDPVNDSWSAAGTVVQRLYHTATRLANGKVLVVGGNDFNAGIEGVTAGMSSVQLFDPPTKTWSTVASLPAPRTGHAATLLPSGQVLVAGGGDPSLNMLASTLLYDPSGNQWSSGPALSVARRGISLVTLSDSRVLAIGGENPYNLHTWATTEIYDPTLNSWSATGDLLTPGARSSVALADGRVLAVGGGAYYYEDVVSEYYDPGTLPPSAPVIGTATAASGGASVSFTPPVYGGSGGVSTYTATSAPGGFTGSCTAPCTSITVSGLSPLVSYSFTVRANNLNGTGPASAASNSIMPLGLAQAALNLSAVSTTVALNASTTFSLSGGSGSGAVTFSVDNANCTLSAATATGATLIGAAVGSCVVTATKAADPSYMSASATQAFTITKAAQTISFGSLSDRPIGAGAFSVSATASSGLVVSFSTLTASVCTVAGTAVTPVTTGVCTLRASQAGDSSYTAAVDVDRSFNIVAASAPGAPSIGVATPGNHQATIAFIAPASDGGSAITGYTVVCGAFSANGTLSPITVTGLSNGASYSCSVTAINAIGAGPASGSVNVTPSSGIALAAVQSRKLHGSVGEFDIAIDTSVTVDGNVVVEPRMTEGGGVHRVVFQFSRAVESVAAVSAQDGNAMSIGSPTAAISGSEVTVTLSGVPDATRVSVQLSGVNGTLTVAAAMGYLVGDLNNTRSVSSSDISAIKQRSGMAVDGSTFKYDVNLSGTIGSSDISAVKVRSGNLLP